MAVTTRPVIRKPFGKGDAGLTKSWSFKESLRVFRRNIVPSSSHEANDSMEKDVTNLQHVYFPSRDVTRCDVWRALSPRELPDVASFQVVPAQTLSKDVFGSLTGPGSGLLAVKKWPKAKLTNKELLGKWTTIKNRKAYGLSVSLYEKNPLTNRLIGEPNADAFVVRARNDCAFLAIADGVNWGRDSMQAARCAIFAVYEYLENHLFDPDGAKATVQDTRDAAQLLFEAFSAAQECIVSSTTGLTTLCVALILPVSETEQASSTSQSPSHSSSSSTSGSERPPTESQDHDQSPRRFALILASVGDSQAFLLSKFHGIREVTGWVSHSPTSRTFSGTGLKGTRAEQADPIIACADPWKMVEGRNDESPDQGFSETPPERDFRDAGGALGAVHKNGNPELHNLICAVTLCDPGDLVILGTDGLTDNFDPVITRIALPESPQLDFVDEQDDSDVSHDSLDTPDHIDTQSNGSFPERISVPARSWYTPLALSSPPQVSIWPRPPPPPTQMQASTTQSTPSKFTMAPDRPVRFVSELSRLATTCGAHASPTDGISACSLNFTNQLELNWAERRRYSGKEMERVWHETDAAICSSGQGQASSRDLCEALIHHVLNTTTTKRTLLQKPEFARLRMSPLERLKLNDQIDEDELRQQRQWLTETLKRTPGKLDHATVVAYEVGVYRGDENEVYEEISHRLHVPQKRCSSPK